MTVRESWELGGCMDKKPIWIIYKDGKVWGYSDSPSGEAIPQIFDHSQQSIRYYPSTDLGD